MTDKDEHPEIPEECMGPTGPLSTDQPTESDNKITKDLINVMANLNIFETTEEVAQRQEALLQLQDICNRWIRAKALEMNYPEHIAQTVSGKLYAFGSYRLAVNTRGADIDALLLAPRFISREAFFDEFFAILHDNANVEDLVGVPEAYVPVMKMKFMGVEIDLLFAKVDLQTIPVDFSLVDKTEQVLRNMDERDVRSINGVRVTEAILMLVYNKENFKTSLKVIRLWAKNKGIYSNSLGFFGGVTWAILVARICQLFPNAAPATIVFQFFNVLKQWKWPRPIMLKNTEIVHDFGFPNWDPRVNVSDQFHLMPVITPAYPYQNSSYNVSISNMIVMIDHIESAVPLLKDILMRKAAWEDFFKPSHFFSYRHYVVVIVTGIDKEQFNGMCGLVESKIRLLVGNFERNKFVELAHVNSQSWGHCHDAEPELIRKWFIGMRFRKTDANTRVNVDLSYDINHFEKSIGRGLHNEDLADFVSVKYAKRSNLGEYLSKEEMERIAQQPVPSVTRKRSTPSTSEQLSRRESTDSIASLVNVSSDVAAVADSTPAVKSPPDMEKELNGELDAMRSKMDAVVSDGVAEAPCSAVEGLPSPPKKVRLAEENTSTNGVKVPEVPPAEEAS